MAKMIPVESSLIAAIGYDPEAMQLSIEFVGGAVYRYSRVPVELYDGILNAESHGKAFHRLVRPFPDLYPFERIK